MNAETAETSSFNVPNSLTILRIVLVPVFAWMLLSHPHDATWRIWTTVMFTIAILTDTLDGWWARHFNIITNFGKIADPFADKALTGMALVGLSIIGELHWAITIIILIREWGITLLRFLLLRRGVVLAASKGGKMKTLTQSIALILFLLPLPAYALGQPLSLAVIPEIVSWLIMAVALILTITTGIDYVRKNAMGPSNRKPPVNSPRP